MSERAEESWKRRIGNQEKDLWAYLAEPRLWLTIKDSPQTTDEGNLVDESGEPPKTPEQPTVSNQTNSFQSLSPLQKYKIISNITKPHGAIYNKDKTMHVQVTSEDATLLLNTTELIGYKINVSKHRFMNTIRGTIKSNTLNDMTVNEIVDALQPYNCTHARKIEKPKRDHNDKIARDENNKMIWVPNGVVVISLETEFLPPRLMIVGMSLEVNSYAPD